MMNKKLFFEDGSALEISIVVPDDGKMAMTAYRKLTDYIDDELMDNPELPLQAEDEEVVSLEEEEDEADLELDDEDLDDLDEFDDDWIDDDEDEEELEEDWAEEDDYGVWPSRTSRRAY